MNSLVGTLLVCAYLAVAQARSLWASTPAVSSPESILTTGYPLGNGRLGAIPFGTPGSDRVLLNIDSLWSGGPFENTSYTGGNPSTARYSSLQGIRSKIFQSGTGDVNDLLGNGNNFGSYRVLGNLNVDLVGISRYTRYNRTLDLTTGVHTTSFEANGANYSLSVFCSYPDQGCVYGIEADAALPTISVRLDNPLVPSSLQQLSCGNGYVRLAGNTQAGPPRGLRYDTIARLVAGHAASSCSSGRLTVTPSPQARSLTIFVAAGTNYDQKKGNAEAGYSFQGADPGPSVEATASSAARKSLEELRARHIDDYGSLQAVFSLNLPDAAQSASLETSALISRHRASAAGDPFLEALLFDYSRHLLISSSRKNSLPANLQGRWTEVLNPAWNSDYHANINLQMNYWAASQTGLQDPLTALWNYMEDTWVPRGTETARLLYGGPGFVVHHEINIFGFTAMKDVAVWANYPAAAAWMMQLVWDNFDYTQDESWLGKQGYPLMKGVARFWLSQLQPDGFSKDGSLVVVPCNSPEHGPTTFGCAHDQQLIHQVLEGVLASAPLVSETDESFLSNVSTALASLDKGVHMTSWGGIKEWKLPDSFGYDTQNTHRHLSHLVGWYPGYAVASFANGYDNATIQKAIQTTLEARGDGSQSDCDCGWSKVWRAACWARLNNTDRAYAMLRMAIDSNLAPNGLSMYSGRAPPFQIDANLGFGGAVLSMLVVDLPLPYARRNETRKVVLGPAIPPRWSPGSVKGLRVRGGGSVDFAWDAAGVVTRATLNGRHKPLVLVNRAGKIVAQV